jgi:hypothetical protein
MKVLFVVASKNKVFEYISKVPRHFNIMTLRRMTLSVIDFMVTISIMGLIATLRIATLNIECHYAECCSF